LLSPGVRSLRASAASDASLTVLSAKSRRARCGNTGPPPVKSSASSSSPRLDAKVSSVALASSPCCASDTASRADPTVTAAIGLAANSRPYSASASSLG
jgi:hypothetical protein